MKKYFAISVLAALSLNAFAASSVLAPSGKTVSDFNVLTSEFYTLGAKPGQSVADLIASHPRLASFVATVQSVTDVRETSANKIDVYSGEEVIVIIRKRDSGDRVSKTSVGFTADNIVLTPGMDAEANLANLDFNLTDCMSTKDANTGKATMSCATVFATLNLKK